MKVHAPRLEEVEKITTSFVDAKIEEINFIAYLGQWEIEKNTNLLLVYANDKNELYVVEGDKAPNENNKFEWKSEPISQAEAEKLIENHKRMQQSIEDISAQKQEDAKFKYNSIPDAIAASDFESAKQVLEDLLSDPKHHEKLFSRKSSMGRSINKVANTYTSLEAILYNNPEKYLNENKELKPGAKEFLHAMYEAGVNPNDNFKDGETLLNRYVETGSVELVKTVVECKKYPVDLAASHISGYDSLDAAVLAGHLDMIKYLVEDLKFNVNRDNYFNNSRIPLHLACIRLENETNMAHGEAVIDLLIELGANVAARDKSSELFTPAELIPVIDITDESGPEEIEKNKFLDKIFTKLGDLQKIQDAKPVELKKSSFSNKHSF